MQGSGYVSNKNEDECRTIRARKRTSRVESVIEKNKHMMSWNFSRRRGKGDIASLAEARASSPFCELHEGGGTRSFFGSRSLMMLLIPVCHGYSAPAFPVLECKPSRLESEFAHVRMLDILELPVTLGITCLLRSNSQYQCTGMLEIRTTSNERPKYVY